MGRGHASPRVGLGAGQEQVPACVCHYRRRQRYAGIIIAGCLLRMLLACIAAVQTSRSLLGLVQQAMRLGAPDAAGGHAVGAERRVGLGTTNLYSQWGPMAACAFELLAEGFPSTLTLSPEPCASAGAGCATRSCWRGWSARSRSRPAATSMPRSREPDDDCLLGIRGLRAAGLA